MAFRRCVIHVKSGLFMDFFDLFSSFPIEAITFSPFIFSRGNMNEIVFNHEFIHAKQQQEISLLFTALIGCLMLLTGTPQFLPLLVCLWMPIIGPFYVLYALMYVWNASAVILGSSEEDPYESIPFEAESYENEHNLDYVTARSVFAWMRYI